MTVWGEVVPVAALAAGLVAAVGPLWRRSRVLDELVELRHQATHDELTGLLNRRGFTDAALAAIAAAGSAPVVVVVGDLNGFRQVNTVHHHEGGDTVLRAIGGRVTRLAAERGMVAARLGGDEFAFIASEDADVEAIAEVVAEPVWVNPAVAVSVSIALGAVKTSANDIGDVAGLGAALKIADDRSYTAKATGLIEYASLAHVEPLPASRPVVRDRDLRRVGVAA